MSMVALMQMDKEADKSIVTPKRGHSRHKAMHHCYVLRSLSQLDAWIFTFGFISVKDDYLLCWCIAAIDNVTELHLPPVAIDENLHALKIYHFWVGYDMLPLMEVIPMWCRISNEMNQILWLCEAYCCLWKCYLLSLKAQFSNIH